MKFNDTEAVAAINNCAQSISDIQNESTSAHIFGRICQYVFENLQTSLRHLSMQFTFCLAD